MPASIEKCGNTPAPLVLPPAGVKMEVIEVGAMMTQISDELVKLAALRDQGVLTEAEFERRKAILLDAPKVDAADRPKKSRGAGKGCLILLAIIVALIAIGAIFGGDKKAGAPKPAAVPVKVTAKELFRAYQQNEASAQQTYGTAPLLVTAVIAGVDLDFADKPVVKLATDNQFMPAQASLVEADQPKAAGMKKGETITLSCSGVSEVIGTPILKECELH